jgi:hypothetical protein
MIRALFAVGLALLLPSSRVDAQVVSFEPIVNVAGVVDVRWRTIVDPLGHESRLPYFFRASPDDIRRAQQVLTVDRDYLQAQAIADVGAAERILAPAFIGLDEEGRPANKADTVSRLRTLASDRSEMSRATVRLSDNIAVISGEQNSIAAGRTLLFARVYLETRPGSWQLVSSTRFRAN